MTRVAQIFLLAGMLMVMPVAVQALKPAGADPGSHPPRIIRTCCMFGSRVGVVGIPFLKLSAITSTEKMGQHRFLGGASESNGVVYTLHGGFIDMGHLRDNADWTAWIYTLLETHREDTLIERVLGYEGGEKRLSIHLPADVSDEDMLLLAGRIAYDLAVWHEIATWYGVSSVPLVSEQYSSFSVEDTYSNLQGVLLGMEAIRSPLPYEEAMTALVAARLQKLGAVEDEQSTIAAMERVRDIWWTRLRRYPSAKVVMLRNVHPYAAVYPILVDQPAEIPHSFLPLLLPPVNTQGDTLTQFYTFSIRANHKFPLKRLFPGDKDPLVTQHDFPLFLADINTEYATGFLVPRKLKPYNGEKVTDGSNSRKNQRKENKQKHEDYKG